MRAANPRGAYDLKWRARKHLAIQAMRWPEQASQEASVLPHTGHCPRFHGVASSCKGSLRRPPVRSVNLFAADNACALPAPRGVCACNWHATCLGRRSTYGAQRASCATGGACALVKPIINSNANGTVRRVGRLNVRGPPVVLAVPAYGNRRRYTKNKASDTDDRMENLRGGARRESILNSPSPCAALRQQRRAATQNISLAGVCVACHRELNKKTS